MRLNHVPPRTGLEWVKQGLRVFARQPLAISGLFFMFMAALTVLSVVPFFGSLVAVLITPAATLGLMAASAEATQGRFPMPSTLVSAFRKDPQHTKSILMLGALYVGALLSLVAVAVVLGPDMPSGTDPQELTPELVSTLLSSPGLWLAGMLYVPVLMAFWHAPALVHWHGIAPVKSLFFSLLGCWNNRGAFVVYLLAWFGLMLGGVFLITFIAQAAGATTVGFLVYPMALMFASVFYASLFFTFRDSFEFDLPAETPLP